MSLRTKPTQHKPLLAAGTITVAEIQNTPAENWTAELDPCDAQLRLADDALYVVLTARSANSEPSHFLTGPSLLRSALTVGQISEIPASHA